MTLTNGKLWRESSTLILLARSGKSQVKTDKFDYKVLVLKRTAKSRFMPCSLVFPGGVIEKGDSSRNWLALYESLGVPFNALTKVTQVNGERPPIFQYKPSDDELKREISLRISCIRETFEELGVLICRDKTDIQNKDVSSKFASFKTIDNAREWQKKVHEDHTQFMNLCETYSMVPDIWGTHEWSAWLTPIALKGPRFEAAFYLAALNDIPDVLAEKHEVQTSMWQSPVGLLSLHNKEEEWLPPPQHYELSRLAGVTELDKVASFAKDRSSKGSKLFYPIFVNAKDGVIHLLPGDKHYPQQPSFDKDDGDSKHREDVPMAEQRPVDGPVHRTEHKQPFFNMQLVLSKFEPHCGHLKPVVETKNETEDEQSVVKSADESKSKL
uniref:Putative nucleoside diphosphate-linked moiety x motif 19 n=1 Tax=Xenopsylla cheopis TaxID=163159 RepID=A0A6M2DQE4_XENCH